MPLDQVNNLKLQHLVELSKLGSRCADMEDAMHRWLVEHDVVYDGKPIPFVLMPHFLSPGQLRRVREAVASLSALLDRFCDAYCDHGALRDELALSPVEDELIRLDPGYPRPMRLCRLDAFLHGYEVRFLEFNADSPAGIGYTDVLREGLSATLELPGLDGEFTTDYSPMLPRLLDTLVDAYMSFREGSAPDLPETPRMALVDLPGAPALPEFHIIARAAAERGLEAAPVTLDELSYDGSLLRAAGEPVHLVLRRALLEQLLEHDGAGREDLLAAAREHRACLVNPFRARVANNKKLFALLEDPRFAHLVNRHDGAVIKATIPWTRILRDGRSTQRDWVLDLLPFVSDNRERLVLKPASDYGGRGVVLGMETSQPDWDALIERHHRDGTYVVQEYVPVPEEMFPAIDGGQLYARRKRFNINPFAIDGTYAGILTRISDHAVINVSHGGGLLPSVVAERIPTETEFPTRREDGGGPGG